MLWYNVNSEFNFARGTAQGSRTGVFTPSSGQPPQHSSLLTSAQRSLFKKDMHESGCMKRRTQDQPITKETARKKKRARGGLASTRQGDAVPGNQDSVTRGIQNLQFADILAAQPDLADRQTDRPLVTMPNSWRHTQRPVHQREFVPCAQCGANLLAFSSSSGDGLMEHTSQKH